jgi:hypothetical protein
MSSSQVKGVPHPEVCHRGSAPRVPDARLDRGRTAAARRLGVRGVAGIVTNAAAVIRAACDAF